MGKDSHYSQPILKDFFQYLVEHFGAQKCVYVSMEGYENFEVSPDVVELELFSFATNPSGFTDKVNLLIYDNPVHFQDVRMDAIKDFGKYKRYREFDVVLRTISLISDQGVALMLTDPRGLSGYQGRNFQKDLRQYGWHVLGYIELPVTDSNTSFQPLLAIITKKQNKTVLIGSLFDSIDEIKTARFICELDKKDWKKTSYLRESSDFRGFRIEKIQNELQSLLNSQSSFQLERLGDFVNSTEIIRAVDEDFTIRTSDVLVSKNLLGKHLENFLVHGDEINFKIRFSILLSLTEKLLPSYLKRFMNSDLGRMILEVATDGNFAKTIRSKRLIDLEIPVPPIDIQHNFIRTFDSLEKLKREIITLEKELVYNPKNVDSVSDDVINLLSSIGRVNASDKIKSIIRTGENKMTEFKQTLSWDIKEKQKKKYIEDSSIRTIAGFLNAEGGTLLVGVHDSGEVKGVDYEIEKLHQGKNDKFLVYFNNLFNTRLRGKTVEVNWELETVDSKTILVVKVEKSPNPTWIDKDFYARTNPATVKLEGEDLHNYMKRRFKDNE